jgi:predicted P-loop ATPase
MNETAKVLGVKEVIELIGSHIDAYQKGGPDRKEEDIELARSVGLKVGGIAARWDDAYDERYEARLAGVTDVGKEPTRPSASTAVSFRRSFATAHERLAKKEELFISPEIQPMRAEPQKLATEAAQPEPELSKLILSLGAQQREEVFKSLSGGQRALMTTTQSLAFQHSKSPAGIPASLENAITAINKLDIDCKYDIFHDRIVVKGHECGVNGDVLENLENVTLKVRQAVLTRFSFDPSATFTFDALKLRCLDRVFDPIRDYLDGLRWDGKARLGNWLVQYCGADDTELNRAIGRKMLVAAVRRVRSPGCKFDYIVVLEGAQGVGKSSLLRLLAGEENFTDNEIIGLDKREQQEAIQGVWIYEVAELDGLHKSDVTKVKLFASKTVDSARPAYARSRVDRPRRGIFVATTNEDTYLRDTTGNRRFWPVQVGKINLDWVRQDRDQLWAEACELEASGEPLVIPEALWPHAAAQQQARMDLDPWEDAIVTKLSRMMVHNTKLDGSFVQAADTNGRPEWRVATDYLLTDLLGLPKERQTNNHTKRLASIMRVLGWSRSDTPMRIGKHIKRGFVRPTGEPIPWE